MPKLQNSAGYSGTPLIKKLGIKSGLRISLVGKPDDYWDLIGELPSGVDVVGPRAKNVDFVHIFAKRVIDLDRKVSAARGRIVQNGMIWASWPKKTSGVASDITEDEVRRIAFAHKLVDVKVCAVDETWSGLKLVIRVKER